MLRWQWSRGQVVEPVVWRILRVIWAANHRNPLRYNESKTTSERKKHTTNQSSKQQHTIGWFGVYSTWEIVKVGQSCANPIYQLLAHQPHTSVVFFYRSLLSSFYAADQAYDGQCILLLVPNGSHIRRLSSFSALVQSNRTDSISQDTSAVI